MLTREGFVAADMSAPTPLQRSSWKAEAIRRGNLKISGPIPITEDLPLNEDEEREFAEKGELDSSLQPQDALEDQSQRPQTPPAPPLPAPSAPEQLLALRSNPVEGHLSQREDLSDRQPSRSPPKARQVNEMPQESVVQTASYTPPTPFRSTPESPAKAAQKKQRKSGLRNVFRKMFGRRSRDENENHEETAHRGHSYHHSDPGMLRQSLPTEQKKPNEPRISDLPVKDLQPLHPIGQHLPFPMNVNAPQASPPHKYLNFDVQREDMGRRRATLPTVPSASIHRHSLDEQLGKLSTWEERQEEDVLPSPGIGIALSSPSQVPTPMQSRRRSRSADALHELVKGRASIERRRSAEIRYWRQSYATESVYSRPETAKTMETIRSVHTQEPMINQPEKEPIIEMSATLAHADEPETPVEEHTQKEDREFQSPVSAFNFGNLKDEILDKESVPEPLEEAPPPPSRSPKRLSIEDRVEHLENAYESLESSVRHMSTRNNRQTIILENAPKTLRSRDRSSSARSVSASRSRYTTSIHQEPIHHSSNDTLNPESTSPVLTHPVGAGSNSEEASQYALKTMYEALKHERSARKALEQQVCTLTHDVSDLHALVNKLIASATATSPSYPTPSPDTLIISNEERLVTPRAEIHDRGQVYGKNNERESVISKFSRSETGSESEYEEESLKTNYDDVATPDVWATPKEEGFGGSGFFHYRGEKI